MQNIHTLIKMRFLIGVRCFYTRNLYYTLYLFYILKRLLTEDVKLYFWHHINTRYTKKMNGKKKFNEELN